MYLSNNFTLAEFTQSQTALRSSINNTPPPELLPALKRTAQGLEQVRERLGNKPIIVSSAYRCPLLNTLIGSKPSSQHISGQAVDFKCPSFGTPAQIVRKLVGSGIAYDQCILEFGAWVHVSFSDTPRMQALVIDATGTRAYV